MAELKKIGFLVEIDAAKLFALLPQIGADVQVVFNGEPPRGKALKNKMSPLLLGDQSKKGPATPELVMAFLQKQDKPVGPATIIKEVEASGKSHASVYAALRSLRDRKKITMDKVTGLYQLAKQGGK